MIPAAPQLDGEWLCHPSPRLGPDIISRNRIQQNSYPDTIGFIRASIRQDMNVDQQPLVLTGHQPEWFHPGVWAKNFLAYGIAKLCSGISANCVIDSDLPRTCAISIPAQAIKGNPTRMQLVPFQSFPEKDTPWEAWQMSDPVLAVESFEKISRLLASWGLDSLATPSIPILGKQRVGTPMSKVISACRRHFESLWGSPNIELFLSDVTSSLGFANLLALLIKYLPAASQSYNAAIHDYRIRRNIHTPGRPIPPLSQSGDWFEAPVWVSCTAQPARQRLFLRREGIAWKWRSENHQLYGSIPADDCKSMATVLHTAIRSGIRFRPRALFTSLALRVFLADAFIHGLGGALYDEMTDYWIRHWLKISPPTSFVATMTLRIPFSKPTHPASDIAALQAKWRTCEWHPEHLVQLPNDASWQNLVAEKRRLIAWEPFDHETKRARFDSIRRTNNALKELLNPIRKQLLMVLDQKRLWLREESMFLSREHPWPAHETQTIKTCMTSLANCSTY